LGDDFGSAAIDQLAEQLLFATSADDRELRSGHEAVAADHRAHRAGGEHSGQIVAFEGDQLRVASVAEQKTMRGELQQRVIATGTSIDSAGARAGASFSGSSPRPASWRATLAMICSATGTPANISWWSIPRGKSQSVAAKTSNFAEGNAFWRSSRIPARAAT